MDNWYFIVLIVLAAAGILLLIKRSMSRSRELADRHRLPALPPDYVKDREAARLANMSAEDRSWETSSLQRNRANQERTAPPGK
jgi:hypothetical protein